VARAFNHLNGITDENVRNSLRLLGDRVITLESSITTEERAFNNMSSTGNVMARLQKRSLILEKLCRDIWPPKQVAIPTPTPTPTPPPSGHPNPLHGVLREVDIFQDSAHFEHDISEVLPLGLTWFGALEMRRSYYTEYLRLLDAIATEGYQYARVLFAVGWYPYWQDHEVAPIDFTTQDGRAIQRWADYEAQVVSLGQEFNAVGLQLFVSAGDLQMFNGDLDATAQWARRVGELLNISGVRVAFMDVNEAWQNWTTNSEPTPDEVYQYAVQPFEQGYGHPLISLRSAPYSGDELDGLNLWAGDVIQKHGHRGNYPQDHVTPVRHARGIYYTGEGPIPDKRAGMESEPVGPGASVNTLDDPEALSLLAAANFMGGFAYVFHSGSGVRHWINSTSIDQEPGFSGVARVYSYLPTDLQSAYTVIVHGGLSESPLTDGEGFPGENRVDSVLTSDGSRFVTMVYGENGYTLLKARVGVQFEIITPHTGESHPFTLNAEETLQVYYNAGRILVGTLL